MASPSFPKPSQKHTFKDKAWVNPSRTLYITNITPGTSNSKIEALFKDLDGFIALRRVRTMCFVDFEQKQQATSAMWKTNGVRVLHDQEPILVSYDKDDEEERGGFSMRQKEEEKRRKMEMEASRISYNCSACNHFCFKFARPIADMPVRKTDATVVVNFEKDLVLLVVVKGGVKLLKRDKGIEKQYRYNCELCDVCVGYRSDPYENSNPKYIYVFPQALRLSGFKEDANQAK